MIVLFLVRVWFGPLLVTYTLGKKVLSGALALTHFYFATFKCILSNQHLWNIFPVNNKILKWVVLIQHKRSDDKETVTQTCLMIGVHLRAFFKVLVLFVSNFILLKVQKAIFYTEFYLLQCKMIKLLLHCRLWQCFMTVLRKMFAPWIHF